MAAFNVSDRCVAVQLSHYFYPVHIYERAQVIGRHDSLALIARQLKDGDRVLDLGMGAGSLARLVDRGRGIRFDGVTINPEEQNLAAPYYERTWIADLESVELSALTDVSTYDAVVCADVLEHLRQPAKILQACQRLLKRDGRLLISVPNVGYAGLIAELMEGEFRYRPEGLLDQTHLRFFTRRSLMRFLTECGWSVQSCQAVDLPVLASEFGPDFNLLPPPVAEYLQVLGDARTYQFVVSATRQTAQSSPGASELPPADTATEPLACFSLSLYWSEGHGYDETRKSVGQGLIGCLHQAVRFELEPRSAGYSGLRLDPADRAGYLHLHQMELVSSQGGSLWRWEPNPFGLAQLSKALHHHLLIDSPSWTGSAAPLLLTGNDPWFELPVPPPILHSLATQGGALIVTLGWPVSADYLQAVRHVERLEFDSGRRLMEATDRVNHLEVALSDREVEISKLAVDVQALRARETLLDDQLREAKARLRDSEQSRDELGEKLAVLSEETKELRSRFNLVMGEKTAIQRELDIKSRKIQEQMAQVQGLQSHLARVENTAAYRLSRPVANWYWRLRGGHPANRPASASAAFDNERPTMPDAPIDVIVPVYRGLSDTRRCVESVLGSRTRLPWRLILINDCSPEPEVTDYLRLVSRTDPRILLLENAENLGFVGTVNRGMAISSVADVLLLNSDAAVANDWLDRIALCAYSRPRVASVTPFSNNATICSYPRFCEDNPLPDGYDLERLDRLFAKNLAGHAVEVPTGVGFCMFIRRACLDEVGLFDVANFGKGYGEENDFCVRATSSGWVNLHAMDTFVLHSGGTSFGSTKGPREQQAMETIRRLHPGYEAAVMDFVRRDPARYGRITVDLARLADHSKPIILNVLHDRGGGTLRHVRELVEAFKDRASFLTLAPQPGGVLLQSESSERGSQWQLGFPSAGDNGLIEFLRALGVRQVHYHHLLGHSAEVRQLPLMLEARYDFTAHDFYTYCPQVSMVTAEGRYCGDPGLEGCRACLRQTPVPGVESIDDWRETHAEFLGGARFVLVPSHDAGARIAKLAPSARVRFAPHSDLYQIDLPAPSKRRRRLRDDEPLRILVVGALSKIKGADLLEDVARLAAAQKLPLDFHLIGYAYRQLLKAPKANLTVHGAYEESELDTLIDWLRPDLVWFPAQCPETYSFTLTSALKSGLPIMAPDIGAFPERLQHRNWTWLFRWDAGPDLTVSRLLDLRRRYFVGDALPDVRPLSAESKVTMFDRFDYRKDYLVDAATSTSLGERAFNGDFVGIACAIAGKSGHDKALRPYAGRLLSLVVWLRGRPWMSGLVRLIPYHLQRNVKSWLLR